MSTFSCFGIEADRLYDSFDADGDGTLSYDEFTDGVYPREGPEEEAAESAAAVGGLPFSHTVSLRSNKRVTLISLP